MQLIAVFSLPFFASAYAINATAQSTNQTSEQTSQQNSNASTDQATSQSTSPSTDPSANPTQAELTIKDGSYDLTLQSITPYPGFAFTHAGKSIVFQNEIWSVFEIDNRPVVAIGKKSTEVDSQFTYAGHFIQRGLAFGLHRFDPINGSISTLTGIDPPLKPLSKSLEPIRYSIESSSQNILDLKLHRPSVTHDNKSYRQEVWTLQAKPVAEEQLLPIDFLEGRRYTTLLASGYGDALAGDEKLTFSKTPKGHIGAYAFLTNTAQQVRTTPDPKGILSDSTGKIIPNPGSITYIALTPSSPYNRNIFNALIKFVDSGIDSGKGSTIEFNGYATLQANTKKGEGTQLFIVAANKERTRFYTNIFKEDVKK